MKCSSLCQVALAVWALWAIPARASAQDRFNMPGDPQPGYSVSPIPGFLEIRGRIPTRTRTRPLPATLPAIPRPATQPFPTFTPRSRPPAYRYVSRLPGYPPLPPGYYYIVPVSP